MKTSSEAPLQIPHWRDWIDRSVVYVFRFSVTLLVSLFVIRLGIPHTGTHIEIMMLNPDNRLRMSVFAENRSTINDSSCATPRRNRLTQLSAGLI
jgi:hypothetical protein